METKQHHLCEFFAVRDVSCPGCGYNLRGAQEPRCAECGLSLDGVPPERVVGLFELVQSERYSLRLARWVVVGWVLGVIVINGLMLKISSGFQQAYFPDVAAAPRSFWALLLDWWPVIPMLILLSVGFLVLTRLHHGTATRLIIRSRTGGGMSWAQDLSMCVLVLLGFPLGLLMFWALLSLF